MCQPIEPIQYDHRHARHHRCPVKDQCYSSKIGHLSRNALQPAWLQLTKSWPATKVNTHGVFDLFSYFTFDASVESRPRSANKSPLHRPTTATYYRPRSAARPGSVGSIRPASALKRPSTDPTNTEPQGSILVLSVSAPVFHCIVRSDNTEDVVSELTIGPAFQGNLTRLLRSRKQQQAHGSDIPSITTSEPVKTSSSPAPVFCAPSPLPMSDHPLMQELSAWKREHNE